MNAQQIINEIVIEQKLRRLLLYNRPAEFWNIMKLKVNQKGGLKNGKSRN